MEPYLTPSVEIKNQKLDSHGPLMREKPTTSILLNHNNTTSTEKFAIPIGKHTTHPSREKFLVKDCN